MRVLDSKRNAKGRMIVRVEIGDNERLIAISDGAHYRLGYPVEDVVSDNIIGEAVRVNWCSASQEWVA